MELPNKSLQFDNLMKLHKELEYKLSFSEKGLIEKTKQLEEYQIGTNKGWMYLIDTLTKENKALVEQNQKLRAARNELEK